MTTLQLEHSWISDVDKLYRASYALSLVLAVASLVIWVMILTGRWRALLTRMLIAWLYAAAGVLSLFHLGDASFIYFFASYPLFYVGLKLFFWLLPVVTWLRFGLASHAEAAGRWAELKPVLVILYLPVAGSHLLLWVLFLYLAQGLPPYYAGLYLLALGYMHLYGRGRPEHAPGAEPSDAAAALTGDGTAITAG